MITATTTTPTTREDYRAQLLASLPATIGTRQVAELVGANFETIQGLNRSGKLPFRNISLTRHAIRFLAVDVVDWMLAASAGKQGEEKENKRRGRPVGSRNKVQPQAGA